MQDYEKLAINQLNTGKDLSLVRDSLDKYFKAKDKQKWIDEQRIEYDKLYPTYRTMTDDEYAEYLENVYGEEALPIPQNKTQVLVGYSEDENYITFDEYLEETKVIQEAVLDEDGNIIEPEVTELVHKYIEPEQDSIDSLVNSYPLLIEKQEELAKELKQEELDTLVVTTNTVAYDANGKAIGNMSAVVGLANFRFNQAIASDISTADAYQMIYKDTTIVWKGADNIVHQVQVEYM